MPHVAPWFPDAKFGVFIHWVVQSSAMDGLMPPAEWGSPGWTERAREYAKKFTAEKFDADEWARMFKDWGAKYAVLTTKHHIGFALFDWPGSPFNARRHSPAGRDLVGEYVEALHKHGLKVGLYYSLPDWSHPDFATLAGGKPGRVWGEKDEPERWANFRKFMFDEVRHLLTAYGKIDLLWWDGDWERSAEQWDTPALARMVDELQPHIVMNNRLRHPWIGHYASPESDAPLAPPTRPFEFCTTLGDNWDGPDAMKNLKPIPELVRNFGDTLGMGGNMLLNIAPSADGTIPDEQVKRMAGLGQWITSHAEAVYGSEPGLPPELFHGASTHKGSILYLIAYDQPRDELVVKGIQSEPVRITHLRSGQELAWRRSGGRAVFGKQGWLFIKLPPELMDEHATVVKLEFADDTLEFRTPSKNIQKWRGRPVHSEKEVAEAR